MEWKGGRYESQRQWCTVSCLDVSSGVDAAGSGMAPCRALVLCAGWLLVGGESTVSRQWVQPPVLLAEPGAGPVVCARWCPTLPHPGGCSTIGAVRLSFRVRDGYRAFPCRCDHRDDYMGSARPSSGTSLFGCPCGRLPTRTHACLRGVRVLVVRVGCGPYSGRFAFLNCAHPPPHVACVGVLLLFVLAY